MDSFQFGLLDPDPFHDTDLDSDPGIKNHEKIAIKSTNITKISIFFLNTQLVHKQQNLQKKSFFFKDLHFYFKKVFFLNQVRSPIQYSRNGTRTVLKT